MTTVAPSSSELVTLTVLALLNEKPRHPYALQREIRTRQKSFVTGLPRSLYRAMDRLVADEFVTPVETSREGNRPERTVYEITSEGRQEFYSRIGELLSTPTSETATFSAALSFVGYFPPEGVLHALKARATLVEGEIAELDAVLRLAETHVQRIALLDQEYDRAQLEAELKWTHALIEDLRTGRLTWDAETVVADPSTLIRGAEHVQGDSDVPEIRAVASDTRGDASNRARRAKE